MQTCIKQTKLIHDLCSLVTIDIHFGLEQELQRRSSAGHWSCGCSLHDDVPVPENRVVVEIGGRVEPQVDTLLPASYSFSIHVGLEGVRLSTNVSKELEIHLIVSQSWRWELVHHTQERDQRSASMTNNMGSVQYVNLLRTVVLVFQAAISTAAKSSWNIPWAARHQSCELERSISHGKEYYIVGSDSASWIARDELDPNPNLPEKIGSLGSECSSCRTKPQQPPKQNKYFRSIEKALSQERLAKQQMGLVTCSSASATLH